jgi:hypothetical protein
MGRGTAILVGAVVAAVAFPVLALGLGLPLWLAAVISAGGFAGAWLLLKPAVGPGLTDEAVLEARGETARGLVADGTAALQRLERSLAQIKDKPMRAEVQKLADIGEKVLKDVRTSPDRAMAVRRLLTFYLPNAANLAEGWQTLESRATPSPDRAAQTRQTMHSLGDAFAKLADEVSEPQLQALDLDLKVLNDALKSDLETAK